jgi:hypothetical protein
MKSLLIFATIGLSFCPLLQAVERRRDEVPELTIAPARVPFRERTDRLTFEMVRPSGVKVPVFRLDDGIKPYQETPTWRDKKRKRSK